ncbi:MAG: serine hydrolase domain-containing protein [Candidatus Aminicenantes bacterium]|jgi:CubicO group peptidase (beta-lactamase class C family)
MLRRNNANGFLIPLALTFLLGSCSASSQELEEKIQRVENGLLGAFAVKGQPLQKMSIADRMELYRVPGVSIAVINNYKIEWAKSYGEKSVESADPVTPTTLFQAASISKPVAAAAALSFVEQGICDLDGDVNGKLLSWKVPENEFTAEKKVTLRGLLSHTAGLTVHGFPGYAVDKTIPSLQQVLDGQNPANTKPIRVDILPGEKWRYSGGGYTIMQQLLTDLAGKPFPQILEETVLKPMGMALSTYEQPLSEERAAEAATGHRMNGKPIKGNWHAYPEMAAAGLWTTPTDLARFALEIMFSKDGKSNKVLSRSMVEEMLTVQKGEYGLGLSLGGSDREFSFGHGGSNQGFKSYFLAYPKKGQGAAVMTNGDNGSALYTEILRSLSLEYGWDEFQPEEKTPVNLSPETYDRYAGEYQRSARTFFEVTHENGRLFISPLYFYALGKVKSEIFPESRTEFFCLDTEAQVTFVFDDAGGVEELILKQRGRKMTAKRIKKQPD